MVVPPRNGQGAFVSFLGLVGLSMAILLLAGCDFSRESKPSILIIGVEGLGFEDLECESDGADDYSTSPLASICEEGVRFSHAYAPSPMTQATMASLLTGLYPFDHGVHHNGRDFLSARLSTAAEVALAKGYRTLFASGGPPVWRKSGFAQGFEVFDDVVEISPSVYYRPVEEVTRVFKRWFEQENSNRPFVSYLYLADLQFPQVGTRTIEGDLREKTRDAQVEEVSEGLGQLFAWMKSKKIWASTHVVLVGVNANGTEASSEPSSLSLRSDSVQVSLLIKPIRNDRDKATRWGVDRNVSLVDVGQTVLDWLGAPVARSSLASLQPVSLTSVLQQPDPNWPEDRLIASETAWPDWLEGAGVRWAFRQAQFLYVHDRKPLIFNTLTDRLEALPLRGSDPLWLLVSGNIQMLLREAHLPAFTGMQPHWLERLKLARQLWATDPTEATPVSSGWAAWRLRASLERRDWREVKKLALELGDSIGAYVASRQLGENVPLPRSMCVRLLLATKGDKKVQQAECDDERLLVLYSWQTAKTEEEKISAQDRFGRLFQQLWLDQDISRWNYLNDLRWNVDRQTPDAPSAVEYLLTLKEFEPINKRVLALLSAKDARL
jgi:hypothetical protein